MVLNIFSSNPQDKISQIVQNLNTVLATKDIEISSTYGYLNGFKSFIIECLHEKDDVNIFDM